MLQKFLINLFNSNKLNNYIFNYEFMSINIPPKKFRHIVIFTGGTFPLPKFCKYFFKNHVNPDFIIAADSGLEVLDLFNDYYKKNIFLPDVILGDMDSLKNKNLLKKYKDFSKCQIEKFNPYKDFSDTELALILASKLKSDNSIITLIGGSGGRIDHLMSIYNLFSTSIRPNFWLSSDQLISLVPKNNTISILPSKKSSPISILLPFENNIKTLKSKNFIKSFGLEWEYNLFRNTFIPSLSNEISLEHFSKKIPATIQSKKDILVATEFNSLIKIF